MSTPSTPSTILITHTDQQFRERLRYGLELEGYTVHDAPDGDQGMALALKEHPHLILVDLVLPRLSGAAMMRKIYEADSNMRHIPLIAVIDPRTREEDIDEIVTVAPHVEFIKIEWVLGHIVAKTRELLTRKTQVPERA